MNTLKNHEAPPRVGLFGGTFDPVHRGHLLAALDVSAHARLDRLYFVPSAQPPHKSGSRMAPAEDRLAMVRLALEQHRPRLGVCDAELKRAGPSYSIDTIDTCKKTLPADGHLFFVLGVDAFLEIDTWKACDRLFEETAFIVMSRPGTGQWTPELCRRVERYVQERISEAYRLTAAGNTLAHPVKKPIHLLAVTPVAIASSDIRNMIRQGKAIDAWVAPAVADYIQLRGLYR